MVHGVFYFSIIPNHSINRNAFGVQFGVPKFLIFMYPELFVNPSEINLFKK